MSEYSVKIIVATHKNNQMPSDAMYIPLHVGAEGKKIPMEMSWIGDISRITLGKIFQY